MALQVAYQVQYTSKTHLVLLNVDTQSLLLVLMISSNYGLHTFYYTVHLEDVQNVMFKFMMETQYTTNYFMQMVQMESFAVQHFLLSLYLLGEV